MVRNVFKIRSFRPCYSHAKRSILEKRWSTVRSYLCGDEWNSVAADKDSASVSSFKVAVIQQQFSSDSADCIWSSKAETRISCELNSDDFASIKSSEATVTQPIVAEKDDDTYNDDEYVKRSEEQAGILLEKPNSTLKLFQQEDAAIVIQSAFRHYLARRERSDGMQFPGPSPDESLGSSLKVQTGDSTDTSSFDVERDKNVCKPIQKRVRSSAQVLKLQEDWDDSTVSTSISRKRIQNRIEAASRRERALAYAFAQQLRVCSKKKRTKCNSMDSNSGLSWLDRWMATRESENIFMANQSLRRRGNKRPQQETMMMMMMDAVEGKESSGSNDLSLQLHGFPFNTKDKPLTLTNIISTPKTLPTSTHSAYKVSKKRTQLEQEKHKKQPEIKKNMRFQDSLSTIT